MPAGQSTPSRSASPATPRTSRRRYTAFRRRASEYRARLRHHVRPACADDGVFRGLAGSDLRQSAGRADPPADSSDRRGRFGQSLCASAHASLRRRFGPPRRHVQQNDARAEPAAEPADRRQRPQRRTARLHRGGPVRRSGGRHRGERARDHHGQQRRRGTAGGRRRSRAEPARRPDRQRPAARSLRSCTKRARRGSGSIRGKRNSSATDASASSTCG